MDAPRFSSSGHRWWCLHRSREERHVRAPLCCGDPIRRLVAKCFCVAGRQEISKAFNGRNFGVGCPGGVEVVAHSLRDTLSRHKGSKLGLLKIDFRNAFNEIKRSHFESSLRNDSCDVELDWLVLWFTLYAVV